MINEVEFHQLFQQALAANQSSIEHLIKGEFERLMSSHYGIRDVVVAAAQQIAREVMAERIVQQLEATDLTATIAQAVSAEMAAIAKKAFTADRYGYGALDAQAVRKAVVDSLSDEHRAEIARLVLGQQIQGLVNP